MIEAGRGRVPFGGFAWGEVGAAFHDLPVARSLAGWGGVALVSFVAVAFNGFALDAVLAGRTGRGRDLRRASTALAAGVALALAGHLVLPGPSPAGRLRAALVQGNDHNRELTPAELAARYLPRNHLRLAEGIKRPVDLVVFPESSLDADPRRDPFLDNALSGAARRLQAALLAGGNTEAPGDRLYNTVFLFGPGGERLPLVYRKQHLVPFGEFVPWREALSFIEALDQVPRDYAPGRRPTLFPVEGQRTRSPGDVPRNARGPGRVPLEIGVLICFESAFAPLARTYARDGAAALVVMTNNRSFRRSANSAQHLALSQMRAAETGRPVLHAGISGITGVIDAGGDLRARTSLFEPTVLEATVTATTGRTPYVAMGEWVLALAGTVVAGTVALALTRPRSRPTGDGRGGGS
jgi:apolipoprotein N-acyltransferase